MKCGSGLIMPPALRRRHKRALTRATSATGVEIALDIEQLIYEVNTLLNAASLINRINKT
jgi:hypothetical protein